MDIDKVVRHIFTYKFPTDEELVKFANDCQGFSADGYGVMYSSELDEYDKEIEKYEIPEGSLEIYCLAYSDEEIIIEEKQYLSALKKYLFEIGKLNLIEELKNV